MRAGPSTNAQSVIGSAWVAYCFLLCLGIAATINSILDMARAAALTRHLPKRLLSTTSITHRPRIPSPLFSRRPLISYAVRSLPLAPAHFTSIRCCCLGNTSLNMVSTLGDWALTEIASTNPGMDFEHWFIHMERPEGTTKHELIDCYIKTLAKVVGSEEEAKKKIYKVNCEGKRLLGFGCQIDWQTANRLIGLPGVFSSMVDSYIDPEYKDYGGDFLFVNGELVQRSPERQKSVQKSLLTRCY